MIYGVKGADNRSRTYCKCTCDCGNTCSKRLENLQACSNASCGCMTKKYKSLHNRTNEIGQKFGRLTIEAIDWNIRPSTALCKCDCGNYITANKADVVCGTTQSCGCLQKEKAAEAVTKDFTGFVSTSGVLIISKAIQSEAGAWLWNCKCPLCGEIFIALPAKVMSNHTTSCGCILKSSGERIVESILKQCNYIYIPQYRFPECRDSYALPFDFAVMNKKKEICYLIEYDGRQHYEPVNFWGGEEAFRIRKKHDEIKSSFCERNNIPLLRLSYLDDEQTIRKKITNIIYP